MVDAEIMAVGGGLAGAAFALELARNGREVVIVESAAGPRHKVCGEFLSPEARSILAYLGLDISAMGASTVGTLRLALGEKEAIVPLPFEAAGLSRYRLDDALLSAAASAGAQISRGSHVKTLEHRTDGAIVATTVSGKSFRARDCALATGKHSLRGFPRPMSDKVAFKMQLHVGADAARHIDKRVQLAAFPDGYCGACFVEEGRVAVCWVMRERLLKRIGSSWECQSSYFREQSSHLRVLLENATPLYDKPLAIAGIPYGFLRREVIAPNLFPIGDQLAVIPSYTGDGNAIALFSGVAAAQAILAGRNSVSFQADMIGRLKLQFRWANTVNLMFEYRASQRLAIAAAARLPGIVTRIAHSTRLRQFEDIVK